MVEVLELSLFRLRFFLSLLRSHHVEDSLILRSLYPGLPFATCAYFVP